MNKIKHALGIVRNDAAQALTEFAIVIPVVLMFYFAMLQWVQIVQTAQLVNYAAYAAARSYAVQWAIDTSSDKSTAVSHATDAAALALAPVARLVPGEVLSAPALVSLSAFPDFVSLGYGFLVAREVRLNPQFGGSIAITTETAVGSLQQVDVLIHYPQPIYMPGLSELWGIVGGSTLDKGSDIHADLKSLSAGLGGLVGVTGEVASYVPASEPSAFEGLFPGVWSSFAGVVSSVIGAVLPFPYMDVSGKCSMGIENWGSQSQWQPRQPGSGA